MFATFIIKFSHVRAQSSGGMVGRAHHHDWLWTVLWGAAFILRESEEIRFDIVYSMVLRAHAPLFHGIDWHRVVALYGISLPAAYNYVGFMKVERSAYFHIPINWLYAFLSSSVSRAFVGTAGCPTRRSGARSHRRAIQPDFRMTMPRPFPSCIVAIVLLGILGFADRPFHDRGSILYLL
jgi:hypothetical protein